MFIDWIIRMTRGAPGKIKPALRPTHRVGFEHLEARMVMSADFFGYVTGDIAAGDIVMETFPYSEPPFGMVEVLSIESDGMVDFTPDFDSLQNPRRYGSDNIFHEAELTYQAMDGPSEVVVEKGDFSSLEFELLWNPRGHEPESLFSETTFAFFDTTPFTFQTFEGPEDDSLVDSIGLVSLISSDDTIQEVAAIELTRNVNDSFETYALPQPATLQVGSDKIAFQANSNDSNEFLFGKFEQFSLASRPGSSQESGASRLKQPVDGNPTLSSHALGMKDEFVGGDDAVQLDVEQQADVRRTSMQQEVEDLLRGLHSPSSRSVEETEENATPSGPSDSHISPAVSDSHEGGMVLLRAAQHSDGNELFVVDEAYAQLGDLFDIRVRMKPAIGAYQAFDVGSRIGPLEHTHNHPVSSADFSANPIANPIAQHSAKHSRLDDEKIRSQTANDESLSTHTGSGFLATGAIAACCTAVSRYWRQKKTDTINNKPNR